MVLGNSSEGPDSPVGGEDEEEKLLKQAIALSLEEEDNIEQDAQEEDNELLRQAIALSLEGAEEEGYREESSWTFQGESV